MTTYPAKLYQFSLLNVKAYLFAAIFVVGNILLPQLAHLVPQGGLIFLPIYFFTIVGAYKYGLGVGLLTAVLSPLANHLLFDMPSLSVLPILISKGVLAASLAAWASKKFEVVSLFALIGVVLAYQVIGTGVEWILTGSFFVAIQDFRIGLPGMIIQIVGGFLLLKAIANK